MGCERKIFHSADLLSYCVDACVVTFQRCCSNYTSVHLSTAKKAFEHVVGKRLRSGLTAHGWYIPLPVSCSSTCINATKIRLWQAKQLFGKVATAVSGGNTHEVRPSSIFLNGHCKTTHKTSEEAQSASRKKLRVKIIFRSIPTEIFICLFWYQMQHAENAAQSLR